MAILVIVPAVLSLLLLAAHFLRAGSVVLTMACVAMCGLLAVPRRWVLRVVQVVLALGAVEWLASLLSFVEQRQQAGRDWTRGAIIIGTVGAVCLASALLLQHRRGLQRYRKPGAQALDQPL